MTRIGEHGHPAAGSIRRKLSILVMMVLAVSTYSFAADARLIDVTELNRDLSRWVVLDARPRAEWMAGHIPGARSFSWENHTRTDEKGVEYRAIPPQELAVALAGLGIDEKTPVVIYGDTDKSWGGEGWDVWVLSWLGHKGQIALLNGGVQAWRGQNLTLAKGADEFRTKKTRYQFNLKPQLDISTEELVRQRASLALVDVRSTFEWLKGRIPGAIHIPWDKFYTGGERRPLPSAELKKLLTSHGVDTTRPVVYYCAGGIRSAYAWTVHTLAELPAARNYEGGMAAWQKREKIGY
jgi:thiosulfate/3-mercaptopyruvate sulfurtransferase